MDNHSPIAWNNKFQQRKKRKQKNPWRVKKLDLSELKVKSKSGKSKTRKCRKRWKPRNFFSEFSSSEFSILSIGLKSKSRKRKSWKNISEVSNISDVSEFSTWSMCSHVFESHRHSFWALFEVERCYAKCLLGIAPQYRAVLRTGILLELVQRDQWTNFLFHKGIWVFPHKCLSELVF